MPQGHGKEKVTVTVATKDAKQQHRKKVRSERKAKNAQAKKHMPVQKSKPKKKRGPKPQAKLTEEANQMSRVVEAITMPVEAEPIKFGTSKYGGDPTGSCNPSEQVPISFNTNTSGGDVSKTNVMYGFRQATRSNVISYVPSGIIVYEGTDKLFIDPGQFAQFNPGALAAQSVSQPHGRYLYAGRHGPSDPHRGFWVDAGTDIVIATSPAGLPGAGLYVNIKRSNGREWIDSVQGLLLATNPVPGQFEITNILASGYYSFEFGYVDPTKAQSLAVSYLCTVKLTWSQSATGLAYAHLALPDLENQFGAIDAIRINAVSIMATNNSAAIQKQGTLVGVQFDKGTLWSDATDLSHFTSKRKRHVLPSDNGMYGFLKPGEETDFDILSEFVLATSNETNENLFLFPTLSDIAFDIVPKTGYIGIAFDVARVGGTIPAGVTGYWTRGFGIEYITNDQWRSLSRSTLSPQVLELALHLISETPQWHENEFHIDDLWNTIKGFATKIVNGVMDYGPMVVKGATMLAPLLL